MLAVQGVSGCADVHESTLQALNIVLLQSDTEVEHLGSRRRRTLDESDGRTGALLVDEHAAEGRASGNSCHERGEQVESSTHPGMRGL